MVQIKDFTNNELALNYYGGSSRKRSVFIGDDVYMIKFPQNRNEVTDRGICKPVCEYIASNIYRMLGVPTQDVVLGLYQGRPVVACRDLEYEKGKRKYTLSRFLEVVNDFDPRTYESYISSETVILDYCLNHIIYNEKMEKTGVEEVLERFWTMFVIDYIIANPDRKNHKWGFYYPNQGGDRFLVAPVFSNSRAFSLDTSHSVYEDENGNKIDPITRIKAHNYPVLDQVVMSLISKIDFRKIEVLLDEIPDEYNGIHFMYLSTQFYPKIQFKKGPHVTTFNVTCGLFYFI